MARKACLLIIGSLGMCFPIVALDCPSNHVAASDPATQAVHCLDRNLSNSLLIIAEKDCVPCAKLLSRVWKDRKAESTRETWILWVEADPQRCLEAAQKWSGKFKSQCSSRNEVQKKWGLVSTPVVYWVKNHKLREQKGFVDQKGPLPWNIP